MHKHNMQTPCYVCKHCTDAQRNIIQNKTDKKHFDQITITKNTIIKNHNKKSQFRHIHNNHVCIIKQI